MTPCLLLLLLCAGAVHAQPNTLKAAYLYRFAAFVEWPREAFARPDSPLVIGIAGDDELAAQVVQAVAGRQVRGHALAVRRVAPADGAQGVHILFVAAPLRHAGLLAAVRSRPVLTVCDPDPDHVPAPDADPGACMVSFIPDGARLRFHVAREEAASSGLRISARLLAVAP